MKKILVTGSNGQLGSCLQDAATNYLDWEFLFLDRTSLDISNYKQLEALFQTTPFDYCINAAAYTNVDGAENDKENAFLGNATAVQWLAEACKKHSVTLLHISTDYVFDGSKRSPYEEEDIVNPINVYGASKLEGEKAIIETLPQHYIVRTSWLYSQYGHNFMKSIARFASEKEVLTITTEQTGCPTNANDLAEALLMMIANDKKTYGIYHFSNAGVTTWFGFAKAIVEALGVSEKVSVKPIDKYPTFAERPVYSVLNNNKINERFGVKPIDWKESLNTLMAKQTI